MLIALPNPDKSFTSTLFAPLDVFQKLEDASLSKEIQNAGVNDLFDLHFSDVKSAIPDLLVCVEKLYIIQLMRGHLLLSFVLFKE